MQPFFIDLVTRTDESRREFEIHPAVLGAVAHGLSVERYRALLVQLYHVVWHFNPICAAAASRLPDAFKNIRYFLYSHMEEERGHEAWVLADLDAVGMPVERSTTQAPSLVTLALTGYNYWAADRRHPCSVLGMLYALEVIASVYGGPFSAAVKESLLLQDERGISFLASHSTMDAQHLAELRLVLNTIDDVAAQDAIVEATRMNFNHFMRIVEAV
jgi:pyrroloquinoline quinone (PQQ) biosynthesis protein C